MGRKKRTVSLSIKENEYKPDPLVDVSNEFDPTECVEVSNESRVEECPEHGPTENESVATPEDLMNRINSLTETIASLTDENNSLMMTNSELEFENARLTMLLNEKAKKESKPVEKPNEKCYNGTQTTKPQIAQTSTVKNNGYDSWN